MIRGTQPDTTNDDQDIVGYAVIRAHGTAEFFVGLYEISMPQPDIRVTFNATSPPPAVTTTFRRLDADGEYALLCRFDNQSDKDHHATIRATWPD